MPHIMSLGHLVALMLFFFGTTFLITDSTVLHTLRTLVRKIGIIDRMLNCSFCTGTWVGVAYGAVHVRIQPFPDPSSLVCTETIVFFAMLSASSAYIVDMLTQILEKKVHE